MTIDDYIEQNLPLTIRENMLDHPPLLGLPYPYLCPCVSDLFQELYYWDSYFINQGLLLQGNVRQAVWTIDNLRALLDRFGFVPNGNREDYLFNSQPPFLALMVRAAYDVTRDRVWLKAAYTSICREHDFWQTQRTFDFGLSHYDCQPLPEGRVKAAVDCLCSRMGYRPEGTDAALARGMYASGECGWDFTPRMAHRVYCYAPADLNALLWAQEDQLASFARLLGQPDKARQWEACRDRRGRLCRKYLQDADGIFYDYDAERQARTALVSASCFYPLFTGMATPDEAAAAVRLLPRMETRYGLTVCEKHTVPGVFQWGWPNGWPPAHKIVVDGLLRYGYEADAMRIAQKFSRTVERCFAQTGHLWEKYNMADGSVQVTDEYKMPAMLGWTFGVYIAFRKLLDETDHT